MAMEVFEYFSYAYEIFLHMTTILIHQVLLFLPLLNLIFQNFMKFPLQLFKGFDILFLLKDLKLIHHS